MKTRVFKTVAGWDRVNVPEGWRRVYSGNIREGDMLLNCDLFAETGQIRWVRAPVEEIGLPACDAVCIR